jgi:ribonucleoside-diphosphate reductase beta chain
MLLETRTAYKPILYPFALRAFDQHESVHWHLKEINLNKDVEQWAVALTTSQKEFLTQLFRFFTQADVAVAEGYYRKFLPLFAGQPEVAMMMGSYGGREGMHIFSYASLIETLGLPDGEFSAFMSYKAMRDKHDYLAEITLDTHENIYKALAVYAAFTEGMQLFSTFAMLMHFERMGLMPGMTNIVRWSLRDEGLHSENMIALSKVFRAEYLPGVDLEPYIHEVAAKMVELEDAFIDLAFETVGEDINYGLPAHEKPLTKEDVKQYIRHTADYRIKSLGYTPLFGEPDNPLPWLDQLLMATEHTNFFEAKPTEYSKGQIVEDEGGY